MLRRIAKAGFAAALLSTSVQAKKADDSWACEAVLCLSNLGSAMQVKKCVPPIQKLFSPTVSWPGCPATDEYFKFLDTGFVARDGDSTIPWAAEESFGKRYVRFLWRDDPAQSFGTTLRFSDPTLSPE